MLEITAIHPGAREDYGGLQVDGGLHRLVTSEKALLDIAPLPVVLSVVAGAEA